MAALFNLTVMTVSSAFGTSTTIPLGSAATITGVTYLSFALAGATGGTSVDYSILDTGASEIGTATYTSSNTTLTSRTPTKSTNSNNAINASSAAIILCSPRAETLARGPTVQTLTSGTSATYNTAAGAAWIRIRMVGGGSGGGGGGTAGGISGAGTATIWSSGLLTAGGGGATQQNTIGGTGGSATGGNVANIQGATGWGATNIANTNSVGGANSYFGGGGAGTIAQIGGSATANTGAGGGAGPSAVPNAGGSGGGAGGYVEHIITSPSSIYTYSVGTGGAAGAAGSSGFAGGAGASGIIIVEEYYLG